MCFAEMIALERTDISQSSFSDSFAKASPPSASASSIVNESEVVINSAVTLCGVAAKKVPFPPSLIHPP
jgi:hypothetical protein